MLAILGRCRRSGRLNLVPRSSVLVLFGTCFLDMQHASVDGDTFKMKATVAFGDATLILPEGAVVKPSGTGLLAEASVDIPEQDNDATLPTLEIEWTALFGRIRILDPAQWDALNTEEIPPPPTEADRIAEHIIEVEEAVPAIDSGGSEPPATIGLPGAGAGAMAVGVDVAAVGRIDSSEPTSLDPALTADEPSNDGAAPVTSPEVDADDESAAPTVTGDDESAAMSSDGQVNDDGEFAAEAEIADDTSAAPAVVADDGDESPAPAVAADANDESAAPTVVADANDESAAPSLVIAEEEGTESAAPPASAADEDRSAAPLVALEEDGFAAPIVVADEERPAAPPVAGEHEAPELTAPPVPGAEGEEAVAPSTPVPVDANDGSAAPPTSTGDREDRPAAPPLSVDEDEFAAPAVAADSDYRSAAKPIVADADESAVPTVAADEEPSASPATSGDQAKDEPATPPMASDSESAPPSDVASDEDAAAPVPSAGVGEPAAPVSSASETVAVHELGRSDDDRPTGLDRRGSWAVEEVDELPKPVVLTADPYAPEPEDEELVGGVAEADVAAETSATPSRRKTDARTKDGGDAESSVAPGVESTLAHATEGDEIHDSTTGAPVVDDEENVPEEPLVG